MWLCVLWKRQDARGTFSDSSEKQELAGGQVALETKLHTGVRYITWEILGRGCNGQVRLGASSVFLLRGLSAPPEPGERSVFSVIAPCCTFLTGRTCDTE